VVLKPQDLLVALKLTVPGARDLAYAGLAAELGMSVSEVHAAVRRLEAAGLLRSPKGARVPLVGPLLELLVHGVRYVFPPERGGLTRGMPTAHAAPVMKEVVFAGDEPPPVWPASWGEVRGLAFAPLYRSAPDAAQRDPALYDRLALVDALRGGQARERQWAARRLEEILRDAP
jgi:DNA-binding transcriptional MocR family regulator